MILSSADSSKIDTKLNVMLCLCFLFISEVIPELGKEKIWSVCLRKYICQNKNTTWSNVGILREAILWNLVFYYIYF